MTSKESVCLCGLGEVGKPLFELISKHHSATGVDVCQRLPACKRLMLCTFAFPSRYETSSARPPTISICFSQKLTIINSTALMRWHNAFDRGAHGKQAVVNSPIRGKHARMLEELSHYTKFIGAQDPAAGERAANHFQSLGLKTKVLSTPEATELAKLTET